MRHWIGGGNKMRGWIVFFFQRIKFSKKEEGLSAQNPHISGTSTDMQSQLLDYTWATYTSQLVDPTGPGRWCGWPPLPPPPHTHCCSWPHYPQPPIPTEEKEKTGTCIMTVLRNKSVAEPSYFRIATSCRKRETECWAQKITRICFAEVCTVGERGTGM